MTIRPIDIQVLLGKLSDLSIIQQQLQNAAVSEQVKDEQVTQAQSVNKENEVSKTNETEMNRVDEQGGQGAQQQFSSQNKNKKKQNAGKPDIDDPLRGHFLDVER